MRIGPQSKEHIDYQKLLASKYKVGDKIYFQEEKKPYKIIARNDNYMVCTKPFNLKKTYLYTIVSIWEGIRGPDSLIFGPEYNYNDPIDAEKAIAKLEERDRLGGCFDISHRHRCKLNIWRFPE